MPQTAYNRALDLLAARPYSSRDLRRKLVQKEYPEDEVDAAMQRLTEAGLVDDSRYAMTYARSKLVSAGASRRRVKQELARKGVEASTASDAIEQVLVDEEIDTTATLMRVARKKLTSMGNLDPLILRRRLYSFLARKGYDLDEIRAAVDELTRK